MGLEKGSKGGRIWGWKRGWEGAGKENGNGKRKEMGKWGKARGEGKAKGKGKGIT